MEKKRSRRARLDTLLNADQSALFLLNPRRRVVFLNTALEKLTGWSTAALAGMVCEYKSDSAAGSAESFCQSLCPPPQVLTGEPAQAPTYLPNRNGAALPRMIHFFPLLNESGKLQSILGIVTAIGSPAKAKSATPAQQLHAELAALRHSLLERFDQSHFVGRSQSMLRVFQQMQLSQKTLTPITLTGETGTGKEHLARAIHQASPIRQNAFVPLDCLRLPPLEIQSTLRRILRSERESRDNESPQVGRLQPGTLYLSHVEELPRDSQQLVVEGFQSPAPTTGHNLRLIVSSTSAITDLQNGDSPFRDDFYYLVTPLTILLPPLRERMDDLPLLAQLILEHHNSGNEKQLGGFSEEVWHEFREYNWPGNIGELQKVINEAAADCEEGVIQKQHLPFRFRTGRDAQSIGPIKSKSPLSLAQQLEDFEAEIIRNALVEARQNKTLAAQMLEMTRARFYRRMQTLGLEEIDPPSSDSDED